jgi:hypothetical protein
MYHQHATKPHGFAASSALNSLRGAEHAWLVMAAGHCRLAESMEKSAHNRHCRLGSDLCLNLPRRIANDVGSNAFAVPFLGTIPIDRELVVSSLLHQRPQACDSGVTLRGLAIAIVGNHNILDCPRSRWSGRHPGRQLHKCKTKGAHDELRTSHQ